MSDYISRQAAISAICNACGKIDCDKMDKCEKLQLPPADVVPYSIEPDGTLTVTVPKGTKVGRVLVEEDGTHWGGLFYAD